MLCIPQLINYLFFKYDDRNLLLIKKYLQVHYATIVEVRQWGGHAQPQHKENSTH